MRYKQTLVLKRYVKPSIEDLPPLGIPQTIVAIEFEDDDMSDISGITKASSLDFDVDMDDHMDNEDVGNNTIVFRDDGAEEDTEIIDVMDENIWWMPLSVKSLKLKVKTKKYEFKLKLDKFLKNRSFKF